MTAGLVGFKGAYKNGSKPFLLTGETISSLWLQMVLFGMLTGPSW